MNNKMEFKMRYFSNGRHNLNTGECKEYFYLNLYIFETISLMFIVKFNVTKLNLDFILIL